MTNERDLPRQVRRILLAQLDKSLLGLRKRGASDAAVHAARKELKRARATLRFMRECVGKSAYQRDNRDIRDAARPLRTVRDAKVLLHTFIRLSRGADVGDAEALRVRVTRELQREHRVSRERLARTVPPVAALQAVRGRMAGIPESLLRRVAIGAGAKRVYKSGLKAFAGVRQEPTDERLHEWRKQVKCLSNQIDVVSRLSSGHFAKIRKRSRRLADLLGRDHDLAVLQQKIIQFARAAGLADDSHALGVWSQRVARRRAALQHKAHRVGGRLYSKRPRYIAGKIDKRL